MPAALIAMFRILREMFALKRVATLADLERLKLTAANRMMATADPRERAICWKQALLLLDIEGRQRNRVAR